MNKLEVLKQIRIGQRVAEEEVESLEKYFVETNQWNEVFDGEKDLVFGAKGAGKSALYALLNKRADQLRLRGIVVSLAENPIGATVFKNLEVDPPPSEMAFVLLWKLYTLTLIANVLREQAASSDEAKSLTRTLNRAGLLPKVASREGMFSSVQRFISAIFNKNVDSLEGGVAIDPSSGMPVFSGKVNLASGIMQRIDALPVEDLLNVANIALHKSQMSCWLLFDRLDVAFSENAELEKNALRALFRAYRDLRRFDKISLKLFIRNDVWERITDEGFAEASHLIRATDIKWDDGGLRNLIVRRFADSPAFLAYIGKRKEELMASAEEQKAALDYVFPEKVDIGKNPSTMDWMISRVADSTRQTTPRELIHLIDEARTIQIARIERGEGVPSGTFLFDRPVFKQALKQVSSARYQQTFRAENANIVRFTDALRGKKAEQSAESLASLWDVDVNKAKETANRLVELGFFEKRSSSSGQTYWVPFLYRDALELVMGKADVS